MINHQDNFITSLTSGISAGATTAPLASIPTIDAPFYLAFDATNLNGNYEIRMVTSKTATNVNFLACSSPHSADEEVRMVIPSWEADKIYQAPQGFLINGKIVPSVGSNNLTVALKTLAGTDPSALNPIHIRIGDTIRTITSALSGTWNAGTNWLNMGSSELATKEVDLFTYLFWSQNDNGVRLLVSRIPFANVFSDFTSSNTAEKGYIIPSSPSWSATATDQGENIGRFSATLSAGAGYTWSVPTFTSVNLIQRPIFETRMLDWVPTVAGSGSMTISSISFEAINKYQIRMNQMALNVAINFTTGGTASNTITVTYPFAPISGGNLFRGPCAVEATTNAPIPGSYYIGTTIQIRKYDGSNWDLAAGRKIYSPVFYQI